MISLETRASLVTERADVVLPVSLMHERAGSFVNWEGRERPFPVVLHNAQTMSDLRVLAALADGLGRPLGIRTSDEAAAELAELGRWTGERAAPPDAGAAQPSLPGEQAGEQKVVLATWRLALDDSRGVAGEPYLMQTARPAVAMMSPATARAAGIGDRVTVANDRGSITLPARQVESMVEGTVWVPTRAPRLSVSEHLGAIAGELVTIGPPQDLEEVTA